MYKQQACLALAMPVVVRSYLYRLDDYAKVTICISLGKYDIKEDAEEIVATLAKVVGRYSKIVPSS